MTLTVELPPLTIEKLRAESATSGKAVDVLMREAIEVKLAIADRSFLEIMVPVHADFEKSGMTDDELDALIDGGLAEVRAERITARRRP
jgi:hypothetical protein